MTGAVACLALAVLAWPLPSRSAEVERPRPRRWTRAGARRWARPAVAGPLLAGCAVAAAVGVAATALVGALAGGCVVLAGRGWFGRRQEARGESAVLALAELLDALSAELRSGRPVASAVDAALASCADGDCRRSAGQALRAATRGDPAAVSPSAGAEPFAEALARVCAAVRLSNRTGCSLASVLAAVEDDLRERHRQRIQVRTLTAGPRASAALLAALPVLALAMGSGVGADPWRILTATPLGQVLLVAGVALEIAGLGWSGRLIRRALR